MNSFKSQQHRWTKGAIQTGLKLLPRLWRAPLPMRVKVEATFHLTDNFSYVLMIALALLIGPVLHIRHTHGLPWFWALDLPLFLCATGAVTAFYITAMAGSRVPWWKQVLLLPSLMALGIGLAVNNAKAVFEALFHHESPFIRTPKHQAETGWVNLRYRAGGNLLPVFEVVLAVWFALLIAMAARNGQWPAIPFLMLFGGGFALVGLLSAGQRWALGLIRR